MFENRREAGRVLAGTLADYTGRKDVVVLALPRGGVPVAFEIARSLGAPLDVWSVRKLGVPGHEELAMGAIAADGTPVVNQQVVERLGIPTSMIEAEAAAEQQELERRERAYRDQLPRPEVRGKVVIVVDDGLATGSTMRAAVAAVRRQQPARIVVAVPAGSASTCRELEQEADKVICASSPEPFLAVGQAYLDFEQTTDEEVRALLRAARAAGTAGTRTTAGSATSGGDLAGASEEAATGQADAHRDGDTRGGLTAGLTLLRTEPASRPAAAGMGYTNDLESSPSGDSVGEGRQLMTQPDPTPQPTPGYQEATTDPAAQLICQRCGALVADMATDLHDRFHVSIERPATMPSTMTRS